MPTPWRWKFSSVFATILTESCDTRMSVELALASFSGRLAVSWRRRNCALRRLDNASYSGLLSCTADEFADAASMHLPAADRTSAFG